MIRDQHLCGLADKVLHHLSEPGLAKDLATIFIDYITLLVHDIIILNKMLSHIKVMCLDLLLRVLNGLGDNTVLNRHALLHTKLAHNRSDLITTKDPHQIVFQRHIKTGLTRISLTPRPSSELVIDTP